MKWFRFYHDALDDPKVQRLPGETFKFWVNLLCLASQGAERGLIAKSVEEIAFALRVSDDDGAAMMADLIRRGLIEETTDGYGPHNRNGRQFKSDNVADRVHEHRERKKSIDVTAHVTLQAPGEETLHPSVSTDSQITDAEEEVQRERDGADAPATPPKPAPKPKATRLPDDFSVTGEMHTWAREAGAPDQLIAYETDKFRDYWASVAGQRGTKLDWPATWRNWIRRAIDDVPRGSLRVVNGARAPKPSGVDAAFAEVARRNGWDVDGPDDQVIDTTGRVAL